MTPDECVNFRCWSSLTDEVGNVEGEEIARGEEAIGGDGGDVVGVEEVGEGPVEGLDGGVGGLARGGGLGADDHVLAVGLVPDGDDFDTVGEGLDAGLQLGLGLVGEAVAGAYGI